MASKTPQPAIKSVTEQANSLWDKIKIAIGIIAAVLFVIFLIQNWDDVEIDAIVWDGTMKLSVIMIGSFIAGAAAMGGFWGYRNMKD